MDNVQDMLFIMTKNVWLAVLQDIIMMEVSASPVKRDKSGMEMNVSLLQLIQRNQTLQILQDLLSDAQRELTGTNNSSDVFLALLVVLVAKIAILVIPAVLVSNLKLEILYVRKSVEMERNSFLAVTMETQIMVTDVVAHVKSSKDMFVTEVLLIQRILATKVSQLL